MAPGTRFDTLFCRVSGELLFCSRPQSGTWEGTTRSSILLYNAPGFLLEIGGVFGKSQFLSSIYKKDYYTPSPPFETQVGCFFFPLDGWAGLGIPDRHFARTVRVSKNVEPRRGFLPHDIDMCCASSPLENAAGQLFPLQAFPTPPPISFPRLLW